MQTIAVTTIAVVLLTACGPDVRVLRDDIGDDHGADAGSEECRVSYCADTVEYIICDICNCAGEPCKQENYYTGAVISVGVCDSNLVCSAPCPSVFCNELE